MRILHIISGLGVGGAETLLYRLTQMSHATRAQHLVVSLSSVGIMGARLQALGIEVRALGMSNGVPQPLLVRRLASWIVDYAPDVVQTWMYHADLIGGFAARLAKRTLAARSAGSAGFGVFWAIHQSEYPVFASEPKLSVVARCCAASSSRIPDLIICCAEAARANHAKGGYDASRMHVIHNGFDVEAFRPRPDARSNLRGLLGVSEDAPVVGIVGRYHAVKDYDNFIAAIARVHREMPACRFVMIGHELVSENRALQQTLHDAGVADACHLLGPRDDVDALVPGFDVFCLSSRSEGFPTVIGEAMACGVPCVATDVGDTAVLIGDAGRLVPARNPQALAAGLLSVLSLPLDERRNMGELARERIVSVFSIESTWQKYERVYAAVKEGAWECAELRAS
ncbi:Group 1 glycosyl transferase [Burkholderia sp. 8Y]|uniref:glycosyltransferase family 4 protein n=1 Tax=Burkholderia sp. 8Y TaxID=2653133 RepID=UPI0012EFC21D|nr:glycosyltransferase [Burkholderia sp. 8Y]VXA95286.1 Group 1 glycosyl transferase [Burkholderia sp. 8Y]